MREPMGQELIDRYKKNYNIPTDAEITEEMILAHWELEKRLTKELLASNPENREVFERCYSTLYGELWWLNKFIGAVVLYFLLDVIKTGSSSSDNLQKIFMKLAPVKER
jgi:hypothetical protein